MTDKKGSREREIGKLREDAGEENLLCVRRTREVEHDGVREVGETEQHLTQ